MGKPFWYFEGLKGIEPKRQIELMPYMVASTERYQAEEGNPFRTGKSSSLSAGFDGKIGITNNMILDFTINPDFGQVEADPSEVNLTAYESYFEEKRPFFVEGRNILSFGVSPGENESSSDNLFIPVVSADRLIAIFLIMIILIRRPIQLFWGLLNLPEKPATGGRLGHLNPLLPENGLMSFWLRKRIMLRLNR